MKAAIVGIICLIVYLGFIGMAMSYDKNVRFSQEKQEKILERIESNKQKT